MKVLPRLLLLLFLVVATTSAATSATVAGDSPSHEVPLFHPHELLLSSSSSSSSTRLYEVLTTTGLLAISLPSTTGKAGEEDARTTALQGFCSCEKELALHENKELVDSIVLGDGQTRRTTLATATVGTTTPLPFDAAQELSKVCTPSTLEAMESLRDQVADVSKLFVQALDKLLAQTSTSGGSPLPPRPLMRNSYGGSYPTVASIVEASTNLEHFHVYSKSSTSPNTSSESAALELHTDAGLFLAFVPAFNCDLQGSEPDQSFYLKNPNANGEIQKAVFPPNSIAIMLGMGAEQWLKSATTSSSALRLKATRHSVQMVSTSSSSGSSSPTRRAWYGMMHLVPESAVIEEYPRPKTFGEMKEQAQNQKFLQGEEDDGAADISIGCGFSDYDDDSYEEELDLFPATKPRRRRLQHVENAGACNNRTNFYCWMSCLEIPDQDKAQGYITEGYSLYCVDPSIVASSGGKVSDAQDPCVQSDVVGLAMNTNCMGMWLPTVPTSTGVDVYAQPVVVESTTAADQQDFEEPWCYGGTSMYMDGFHWLGTTCVIYLFPKFVLDTAGSLVGACFFTILFGIALEWVIQQRRITTQKFGPGYQRLAVSAGFYGVQLSMGYTIMLVIMIYSIPLFIAVIAGIVSGHVLFSAPDAIFKPKPVVAVVAGAGGGACEGGCGGDGMENEKLSDNGDDDCCGGGGLKGETQTEQGSTANGSSAASNTGGCHRRKNTPLPSQVQDLEIPEGSTPCCQHNL